VSDDGRGANRNDTVADVVDRTARDVAFSGAVRIDRPDTTPLLAAYGLANRAAGIPNNIATRFAIASGSKTFTALVVLSLVNAGALQLSTSARSFLGPDLPAVDDAVTVENLLTHRSGIGEYFDNDSVTAADDDDYVAPFPVHELLTTQAYVPVLDGHAAAFAPGEQFSYCSSGYVVLALIAERASGKSFYDLVAERVTGPAGMVDTAYLRSDELPGDVALGYLTPDGHRTNVFQVPIRGSGDGGAYSTAADVHRLWDALLAGVIVPLDLVEEMFRPRPTRIGSPNCGLGVWLGDNGATIIMEGSDPGASFRSLHHRSANTTVTVLSNTTEGAQPILRAIAEHMTAS
jgi:CubicO group peptidase (beta-lactamase class C family)